MKKKLCVVFASAVAAAALFAFAACGEASAEKPEKGEPHGNVSLSVAFTANTEVMTLTDSTSLKDYMDALSANGELEFGGQEGEYGFFIQSVYGKTAEGTAFWAVYTDLVTIEGDDAVYSNEEWGTYSCNGKTLYSAAYGVSSLPCIEGYTYALVYSTY